jgi:lysine 2,3-aminomutase
VVDAPGGGGKIPVQPQYLISQGPGKVVLRNFEGFITTYAEPPDYDPAEINLQPDQLPHRPEPGQAGVLALLEGDRLAIEPEGFEQTHARGGSEHRLRSGLQNSKWQPLGVGSVPAQIETAEPD